MVGRFPSAVVGHSLGEIAPTYASGYLTQESAWKVAYFRGICSAKLEAYFSYSKGVNACGARIGDRPRGPDSAVSPRSITIFFFGEESLVDTLNAEAELDEQGIFARKLRVPLAYDSRQMKLIAEAYTCMIGELDSSEGVKCLPMVPSVTGSVMIGILQTPVGVISFV
ncbi:Beta-ketoacyl synthase, partial [Metarhizium majus ARSEF 297]